MELRYWRLYADDASEEWKEVDRARIAVILAINYDNSDAVLEELEAAAKRGRPAEIRTAFAYYKITKRGETP